MEAAEEEPPPAPPLTLTDVRARATKLGAVGGVWVVSCLYRYWQYAELVGLFTDLGDAVREIEAEIRREWQDHPREEATAHEVHEAAWEITIATVVLRLEWASVIRPRRRAAR